MDSRQNFIQSPLQVGFVAGVRGRYGVFGTAVSPQLACGRSKEIQKHFNPFWIQVKNWGDSLAAPHIWDLLKTPFSVDLPSFSPKKGFSPQFWSIYPQKPVGVESGMPPISGGVKSGCFALKFRLLSQSKNLLKFFITCLLVGFWFMLLLHSQACRIDMASSVSVGRWHNNPFEISLLFSYRNSIFINFCRMGICKFSQPAYNRRIKIQNLQS